MRSDALPPARNDQKNTNAPLFQILGLFVLALCVPWFTACTAANSAMTSNPTALTQPRTPAQGNFHNGHLTVSATLPAAQVATPYSSAIKVSGGKGSYTFSLSWGALPQGLSLNSSTGYISGTPAKSGQFGFGVHVVDVSGRSGADGFQITVSNSAAVGIVLNPGSTAVQSSGTVQFTAVVSNTSNVGVTWSATDGAISTTGMYKAPSVTKNTQVR